jgi:hypothetical protein
MKWYLVVDDIGAALLRTVNFPRIAPGGPHRAEEPEVEVMHITRGYSRDHRPDLNQVMLALMVEHQAAR